jgi:hypothetical protein
VIEESKATSAKEGDGKLPGEAINEERGNNGEARGDVRKGERVGRVFEETVTIKFSVGPVVAASELEFIATKVLEVAEGEEKGSIEAVENADDEADKGADCAFKDADEDEDDELEVPLRVVLNEPGEDKIVDGRSAEAPSLFKTELSLRNKCKSGGDEEGCSCCEWPEDCLLRRPCERGLPLTR